MSAPDRDFVVRYGAVYEHSPWVAERAAPLAAGNDDMERIARIMAECVDSATRAEQLALIRAHPDLGYRTCIGDGLSEDSRAEQASAGLDRCSTGEFSRFRELNAAYKNKFGFPFVIAVRGLGRAEILDSFSTRLHNDYDEEFRTALREIHKIARLRIESLSAANGR